MTLLIDNFNLNKPAPLDARFIPVADAASLPTITDITSLNDQFLFEGAIIMTLDTKLNYQIHEDVNNPGNYIWVNIGGAAEVLQSGTIDITIATTTLDLSLVTPAIALCDKVTINITDGTSASIELITNFPANQSITFFSTIGQEVTFIHTEYDIPGNDSIVIEDSFNFKLTGRADAYDFITFKKHAVKVCQEAAVQYLKRSEITALLGQFAPIDALNSTSTTNSLSANQGRILNDLIGTKQDAFLIGGHLFYSGSTAPYSLDSLPFNFKVIASESSLANAVNLAHTAGVDNNFFRVYYSQSEGTHILFPRVASKNVLTGGHNWLQISAGTESLKVCKYNVYSDPALNAVVGTEYYLKIDNSTRIADDLDVAFNSDGSATIKPNIQLTNGLYKIKLKLNVTTVGVQNIQLKLFLAGDLGTNAAPLNATNTLKDIHFETSAANTTSTLVVETLAECTSINGENVIVMRLETDTDFTGFSLPAYSGFLEIEKIRTIVIANEFL